MSDKFPIPADGYTMGQSNGQPIEESTANSPFAMHIWQHKQIPATGGPGDIFSPYAEPLRSIILILICHTEVHCMRDPSILPSQAIPFGTSIPESFSKSWMTLWTLGINNEARVAEAFTALASIGNA